MEGVCVGLELELELDLLGVCLLDPRRAVPKKTFQMAISTLERISFLYHT